MKHDITNAPANLNAAEKTEEETFDVLLRRCAMTRNRRPREQLLRFVLDPQGKLTEDLAGRLPGRGVYVTSERKWVTALLAKHKIVKEEQEAQLTRLEQALVKRLLDGVGLARRAGSCLAGLRSVEELLQRGQRPLVLLASDAGTVREKLDCMLAGIDKIEILEIVNQESLGTVWGGRSVALIAVTHPGIGKKIRIDALRWRLFTRTVDMTDTERAKRPGRGADHKIPKESGHTGKHSAGS